MRERSHKHSVCSEDETWECLFACGSLCFYVCVCLVTNIFEGVDSNNVYSTSGEQPKTLDLYLVLHIVVAVQCRL